jgi:hypothetical protein
MLDFEHWHPFFVATLEAIDLPFSEDSLDYIPSSKQFVLSAWETWGDFQPETLLAAMESALPLEASFAASLLFFQEPQRILSDSETYLSHPNLWIRWPLTLLLAKKQVPGSFEAVCHMLAEDMTAEEFQDVHSLALHKYFWRVKGIDILFATPIPESIPFVHQALIGTLPFSQYVAKSLLFDKVFYFQRQLLGLLHECADTSFVQLADIPPLSLHLWGTTWAALHWERILSMNI